MWGIMRVASEWRRPFNSIQDQPAATCVSDSWPWRSFNSIQDQHDSRFRCTGVQEKNFQFYPRSTLFYINYNKMRIHFQFYPRSTRWAIDAQRHRRDYLSILSKINGELLPNYVVQEMVTFNSIQDQLKVWRSQIVYIPHDLSILSKINGR